MDIRASLPFLGGGATWSAFGACARVRRRTRVGHFAKKAGGGGNIGGEGRGRISPGVGKRRKSYRARARKKRKDCSLRGSPPLDFRMHMKRVYFGFRGKARGERQKSSEAKEVIVGAVRRRGVLAVP
jgi:hypothetical protein